MYKIQSTETLHEYIIELDNQTCSCNVWQSHGIPCGHTLAVILTRREDPQIYIKPFFTLQAYRNIYAHAMIHPQYVLLFIIIYLLFQLGSLADKVYDEWFCK